MDDAGFSADAPGAAGDVAPVEAVDQGSLAEEHRGGTADFQDIDGFVHGWNDTGRQSADSKMSRLQSADSQLSVKPGSAFDSMQSESNPQAQRSGTLQLQRSGTFTVPPGPSRPPPIAGLGFVQEEFQLHEMPLGLVIDWSMALPVVTNVVAGSFAAQRPSLISGLVLVAINKNGLQPGAKRTEVEARLKDTRQRPLWLVFEAPQIERFDFFGARKRARRKNQWKVKTAANAKLPSNDGLALTSQSFFDKYPERIALSRYGDLETREAPPFPLPPPATPVARSMRRVMSGPEPLGVVDTMHGMELSTLRAKHNAVKLPPVLRGGFASTFSGDSADHFSDHASTTNGFGYSNLSGASGYSRPKTGQSWAGTAAPLRKAVSSKSLTWLAESIPRPDAAYEHLVDDPRTCGPGPSERWPLNHEEGYICRLGDMAMAWRVRDAYEVGFRGRKREKVTEMHITCEKGAPQLIKRLARIEEVFCDMCGVDLASPNSQQQANMVDMVQQTMGSPTDAPAALGGAAQPTTAPPRATGAFYYCRKCKKNGNRYELCAACHAVEVLQGEGKHTGPELHPHFLRCEHSSLVRRRFVNDANMGMPHIRRIFCDHCGHLAGSNDTDHEVYVCPTCPEEHGMRFECCAPCAQILAQFGFGVRRLTMARTRQSVVSLST